MSIQIIAFILFYAVLGVLLFIEVKDDEKGRYLCMILLMPILLIYYFSSVPLETINWLIVIGLICGYAGDIFLMFKKRDDFFIFGLGSFLLGHIFYIIGFLLSIVNIMAFPAWGIILFIPEILILAFALLKIKGKMDDMTIPTLVYVGVIGTMGICSILRLAQFDGLGFLFVYLGAIFFMVSDGLIAINKFDKEIKHGEVIIKLTYGLAQFFIARGIIFSTLL